MVRREGRKPTKTLWIFCEGKTEKWYFSKLQYEERIRRLQIKSIKSGHTDAKGVVQEAVDFIGKGRDFQGGDIVSCVFDRDANTNTQLNNARLLAERNSILVSFSNPSFEYWILCHYGYFPSPYEQSGLVSKVKEFISDYNKNDPLLYSKTKVMINDAIDNATRRRDNYNRENVYLISRESNPVTIIFKLIQRINLFRD